MRRIKRKRSKTKPIKSAFEKYELRLYIAGVTPKAVTALKNLRLICEAKLKGKYQINVIDFLKFPRLGSKYQILAIPTLIRLKPHPVRLIIGDLSDSAQLMFGLGII